MNELPHKIVLSVIVPCRNEEKQISECLNSLIAADFPKENVEILVVDGMSDDGTNEILGRYGSSYPFIKILRNHRRITPVGMNIGICESRGKYVMILSSHSKVERDFLAKNVAAIESYDADCVGGILKTLPGKNTLVAQAIAFALSEPFGVGNAYFRIGSKEPRYVDTAIFGCYRREIFEMIGMFDEDLIRNQDDELNHRLLMHGGKVLLVPEIVSFYYGRDSLKKLLGMFYQYGYFKPLVAIKVGSVMTWRQTIPALFVASLFFSCALAILSKLGVALLVIISGSYLTANLLVTFYAALRKNLKYIIPLPIVFGAIHFGYGIGYIRGIIDFMLRKKHKRQQIGEVTLTR